MNKEELLEKAKQDYPWGTPYKEINLEVPSFEERLCRVRGELKIYNYWKGLDEKQEYYITDGFGGCVYDRGVWMDKV